jgi:hypothetical protein
MDPISKAQAAETSQSKRTLRGGHSPYIGKRWPKGVSGNPGGKRKKTPITKMLEEIFDSKTDASEIKDSMALTLKSGRMAGILLLKEAADRLEGRVQDNINVTGEINITLAETIAKRRKKADES